MSTLPKLFQPLDLRSLTLPNRIAVAPMCQYSAVDGLPQPWHDQHYGALAAGGAGLIVLEATGVTAEGRISSHDLGLWNDAQAQALGNLVAHLKSFGHSRIGIQLAHAGRKAAAPGDWQPVAPSALAFDGNSVVPREVSADELTGVAQAFADAARRAVRAGFDLVEIHSAHGYLLHQFLSPLSNRRQDQFGGSWENRLRLPLQVIAAVKAAVPAGYPVGIRVSATDWLEGGLTLDESCAYAQAYARLGVEYVCVSSGGLMPDAPIPVGPGYQVHLARAIKDATANEPAFMAVRAVGMIADAQQAEAVLQEDSAHWVALGRSFLDDPHWVWRAARRLGADLPYPRQYERVSPKYWQG